MVEKVRQFGYERARDIVVELIHKENLKLGDRLPSEKELSRRMKLNHQTVRRGLASLVAENVIDRQVGAGTFLRSIPKMSNSSEGIQGSNRNGVQHVSRTCNRNLIGALVLTKPGNFIAEMLTHLHSEALNRRIEIYLRIVSDLSEISFRQIEEMVSQGCNSLIVPVMPDQPMLNDFVKLVQNSPIPVVLTASLPGLEANCYEKPGKFGMADHAAIEMACRYFHRLKFRHIAFFGPDTPYANSLTHRVFAYNRYMSRYGLGGYVGLVDSNAQDVDRIVKNWTPLAGDLAVICYDDDCALRLMTALHKQDIRIPDDVAILGFNNVPLGESADPPLSTIQFDYRYVAGAMLDHAQAMAQGQSAQTDGGDAREILVIRSSCGGRKRVGDKLDQLVQEIQSNANLSERCETKS